MQLPFTDGAVDVCYSSNVLEHVPDPWLMADEMLRVTRPGGTAFISYTVWYGPWGGHETAPWHFLGGARARRRYATKHGHEPKNKYGESLFRVTVRDGLRWARHPDRGRRGRGAPALQPVVEPLAGPGPGAAGGGDVEPGAGAEEAVSAELPSTRPARSPGSACGSRLPARCSPASP